MLSSSGQPIVVSNNGNGYLGNMSGVRLEKTSQILRDEKDESYKRMRFH